MVCEVSVAICQWGLLAVDGYCFQFKAENAKFDGDIVTAVGFAMVGDQGGLTIAGLDLTILSANVAKCLLGPGRSLRKW